MLLIFRTRLRVKKISKVEKQILTQRISDGQSKLLYKVITNKPGLLTNILNRNYTPDIIVLIKLREIIFLTSVIKKPAQYALSMTQLFRSVTPVRITVPS